MRNANLVAALAAAVVVLVAAGDVRQPTTSPAPTG